MNVSAKDKATNKEQKIKIESSSGLSDEEVERMVKEAEANAEADKVEKESLEHKTKSLLQLKKNTDKMRRRR